MPPRYTDEVKEQALKMIGEGLTPQQVSTHFGGAPSHAVIYRWMRLANNASSLDKVQKEARQVRSTRSRKYTIETKREIFADMQSLQAKPVSFYSEKYKIHSHTIRKWARDLGIRLPRTIKGFARDREEALRECKLRKELPANTESPWHEVPENDPGGEAFFRIEKDTEEPLSLKYRDGRWYYRISTIEDLHDVWRIRREIAENNVEKHQEEIRV